MMTNTDDPYIKTELSGDEMLENSKVKKSRYLDERGSGHGPPEVHIKMKRLEKDEINALDLSKPMKHATSPSADLSEIRPQLDDESYNSNRNNTQVIADAEISPCNTIQRIKIPIMNNLLSKTRAKIDADDIESPPKKPRSPVFKKKKRNFKSAKKKPTNRLYPCFKCNAIFESELEIRNHAAEHEVQSSHNCDECGRYFSKAYNLKSHKRTHLVKEHKCPFCTKIFPLRVSMRRHMNVHKKTLECDYCHKMFHTKDQIIRHIKIFHKEIFNYNNGTPKNQHITSNGASNANRCKEVRSKEENDNHSAVKENGNIDNFEGNENGALKRNLSYPTQLAIVNKMYKGRSVDEICNMYSVTSEEVSEIWEDRAKFKASKSELEESRQLKEKLDNRILEWLEEQKNNNVFVSGKLLQETAELFAKELGVVTFCGDLKWLDRFKKKYNVLLKTNRVGDSLADSKWKTLFLAETWNEARVGVTNDYIYTADEVGFYFNASKGRTKKNMGKKFIQGQVKDRMSIFLCTNASGTDKKKLVVCGSEDPLIHSHRAPETLPVTYIRQSEAHFTAEFFEEYVRSWNRDLQIANRKAVLILDRAAIHTKLKFSHLKLVFVPWKTSGLVPIKNGILTRFRNEFRRLLLEEVAFNVTRGIHRNITCLEALQMFERAWNKVPVEVITSSFIDTGYDIDNSVPVDKSVVEAPNNEQDEMIVDMLKDYDVEYYFTDLTNMDLYMTVEDELLTAQGVPVSVFGGNLKAKEKKLATDNLPIGTSKPETGESEMIVRRSRALEDLDIVQKYLRSNDTPFEIYSNFLEIENFIYKRLQFNTDT